ncbi:hypothetical protein AMECASPLE_018146 [Ameca splendens]|uniref:Uncharacterized protein n=1 Tax=Ameca splendens TaxID=208324 RepID=A0ABV0Z0Q4_9TELE
MYTLCPFNMVSQKNTAGTEVSLGSNKPTYNPVVWELRNCMTTKPIPITVLKGPANGDVCINVEIVDFRRLARLDLTLSYPSQGTLTLHHT